MLPHVSNGPWEPLPSKFADTVVPTLAKGIGKYWNANSAFS